MRLSTSLLIGAAALAACQGNIGDANDDPSNTDIHGGSGTDGGGGIGTMDGGGDADAPLAPVKPPAPVTPPSDDPNAPKVFNHSSSLRGGEVISIQGDNLADAEVWLQGATPQKLPIMNHVGAYWLAARLPATVTEPLIIEVKNASGTSGSLRLDAAIPVNLDTLTLAPGGAFRIFGRNLRMPGVDVKVTVDGLDATIDLAASDEHMLVCTAPAALTAKSNVAITVDNGVGHGPATLDRPACVVAMGSGDPFGLGVGWAAAFSTFSSNVVTPTLAANGTTDDRAAIQAAIDSAASQGGGVVQLPASNIRVGGTLDIPSKVVLRGAGKDKTKLIIGPQRGFGIYNDELSGVMDLALADSGGVQDNAAVQNSKRVFLKNVHIEHNGQQAFLNLNEDFVITGCDFIQTGKNTGQGPIHLGDTHGLVFTSNSITLLTGAAQFPSIHDAYLAGNHISRDSSNQNLDQSDGVVHLMAIDFAYRVAIIGNRFDTLNGPVTNLRRNDGETILTEGGGGARTENLGTVTSATATTLTDTQNTIDLTPGFFEAQPENYAVWIVSGKGFGQMRYLKSYDAATKTITIERPWDVLPDTSSHYATAVTGIEKSLIKNNQLKDNSRGIWIYQTTVRDLDIIGNVTNNNGGIYLRTFQSFPDKQLCAQYNVLVRDNVITSAGGTNNSYAMQGLERLDANDFGVATIGVEWRNNQLTANTPNITAPGSDHAGDRECYSLYTTYFNTSYQGAAVPWVLGSIMQGNKATNCNHAIYSTTGVGGAVILDTQLVNTPDVLSNTPSGGSSTAATDIVVQ